MKRKKRIRIVADAPAPGQDSIAGWIGKEFEAIRHDDEDDTVTIRDDKGSHYVLQPAEYEWC